MSGAVALALRCMNARVAAKVHDPCACKVPSFRVPHAWVFARQTLSSCHPIPSHQATRVKPSVLVASTTLLTARSSSLTTVYSIRAVFAHSHLFVNNNNERPHSQSSQTSSNYTGFCISFSSLHSLPALQTLTPHQHGYRISPTTCLSRRTLCTLSVCRPPPKNSLSK